MPLLIDGNNLMFALRKAGVDAGRATVCNLLANLAGGGQRVCVVFDGRPASGPLAEQIDEPSVEVVYSGGRVADDLLIERIKADTAPRRLVVVSTDHQVRQAARHRRCQSIRSEDFVGPLLEASQPRPPKKQGEPSEKFRGLSEEEASQWLREFDLDDGR
ncbi:MAG: NYN domain-containing protein [Phycisphaerae bacterium]